VRVLAAGIVGIKLGASVHCRRLLRQEMDWPFCLALERAGRSMPARIAMMAITTSSSIKVKPRGDLPQQRTMPPAAGLTEQ
jgi:hypothetical protein